jgi:hypothetical protein
MKNLLLLPLLLFSLLLTAGDDEQDALHNREFHVSLSETRNGVVQKRLVSDLIHFKHGKIQSDYLKKKYGFRYIRYRVNMDTTYVDQTGAEVRLIKLVASATDETNLTVHMELTQLEWDLDGIVRITKNDRLKKYFDLAGREKGGKPPKKKKKKDDEKRSGSVDGNAPA